MARGFKKVQQRLPFPIKHLHLDNGSEFFNDHLLRYFGEEIKCAVLNALYDQLWLYYNLFQPMMHMVGKEVTDGKLHRKHDKAKTPYQRLLACNVLLPEQKTRLAALYARANPRQLRGEIHRAVEQLWQHPASNTSNRQETALLR